MTLFQRIRDNYNGKSQLCEEIANAYKKKANQAERQAREIAQSLLHADLPEEQVDDQLIKLFQTAKFQRANRAQEKARTYQELATSLMLYLVRTSSLEIQLERLVED